ncbi:glyceraldehyde-3-phosphate dehydrogenase (NADP+) [Pseudomonas protegens]|uniref:Putative aldehyde-dehydrogenase-like protein y4uC n=1 Tax=Pseudomonas protegens (strain DSM 19095 / LMG 27888 / CFBP 6595 / CHA0) TaxID=1124983 RepID=A0A2C9EQ30_PSEPH|nr:MULTISPECIES: aldehyde dehydrogenase family protein [Pseudomonas]AGL85628.1 putative aldehyde-dehydrogenase-like protein y4uC [Pseudomonas protegens CHA0]MBP5112554.1 aldehyde dehydrogenase family protein [Pseudomonas protegens]MCS4258364.1 glyceraldehyde-3-phosphate dehydrogenase (NADP+) [Pseudomonas sp. BIGb0176]QTU22977.1 aldehyde dehydrogenase family protein [Pseudomonas protegens]QTU32508.1 aldehyde dehydrogenase family protein [Pseudomonas protegens]
MNLSRLALAADSIDVCSPFDGRLIGTVPRLEACAVPYLLQQARQGVSDCAALPRYQRARILERAALNIERDAEHFARLIVDEAGKTLKQAQKEVKRCINTLKLSAEEAKRNAGEVLPFDAYEGSENRQGWFSREPLGLILAITPYNDPLNLVAHKLGPAIAGGNGVILKPSELAPLSAIKLVDYLRDAGLPTSVVTLATGGADLGKALVEAREVRMVSFTGGFVTGEQIARSAGLKKLVMDLGGNAPVIVMTDCDLAATVESCVSGAFWAAGQNCIGTQRLLVQASIYEAFREAFVRLAREQVSGDPLASSTDIGPMISLQAAQNAQKVVDEALQQGARLLCGHQRRGSCYAATVLENVDHGSRLWQDEVFAPVVVLQPFDDLDQAIALANQPEYSLHAGIFTNDLRIAMDAARRIEAGGVMINDSSDYRFDAMPFGGFKYGSLGREGVRFAYEEMTQPKVVCLNRLG